MDDPPSIYGLHDKLKCCVMVDHVYQSFFHQVLQCRQVLPGSVTHLRNPTGGEVCQKGEVDDNIP